MITDRLLTLLGPDIVKPGPASDPRFHQDWTARIGIVPQAVVLPRSTQDVSAALGLCDRLGVPVVPQGGLTGLVGGAMPTADCVVINLSRLSQPPLIDPDARIATVGAGTTLQTLQDAAAAHGLTFPVDFGARGSCQLGGMIATNAGGIHVVHYGMMRAQVLGLEAVLADGTTLSSMNPLVKNNTGYDLRQLFIGSEGTLGIITRATLRLVPTEPVRAVALLRVANVGAAHDLLAQLTSQGPTLNAFEAMWPSYYAFACDVTGTAPLSQGDGITLLVETSGREASPLQETLLAALEPAMDSGLIKDAVLAQSDAQAQQFWDLREANEALPTRFSFLLGFDVSLPAVAMQDFVQRCQASIATIIPTAQSLFFGHLGDGNLHLAITGTKPKEADQLKDIVLGIVGQLGGSISAEHGVGTDKLAYLGLTRSDAEIDTMRRIKRALDPNCILNPGKLFPCNATARKANPSQPQERAVS